MNNTTTIGNAECPGTLVDTVTPNFVKNISITLLVAHFVFLSVGALLAFLRRKEYPLRRSGIEYSIVSGYGSYLITIYTSGRELIGRSELNCDLYLWLFLFSFPIYIAPLALRFRLLSLRLDWNTLIRDIPLYIESSTDMQQLRRQRQSIGRTRTGLLMLLVVGAMAVFAGIDYAIAENMRKGCTGCILQVRELAAVLVVSTLLAGPIFYYSRKLSSRAADVIQLKWFVYSILFAFVSLVVWFVLDIVDPGELHINNLINWGFLNTFTLSFAYFLAVYIPVWQSYAVQRRKRTASSSSLSTMQSVPTESGKTSMSEFLSTEEGYQAYAEYLAREYSTETIRFWREATRWRIQMSLSEGQTEMTAQEIFDLFLDESAILQVNVSARTRTTVLDELNKVGTGRVPETIFDEAITEVYTLMQNDSWSRFKRSDLYSEKPKKPKGKKLFAALRSPKSSDTDSVRTPITVASSLK